MNEILSIKIDPKSALPVYEQVKRAIKLAILSGRLEEGDQLTSIRELALKLQINPNTIIKVYYQLEVEGFVNSKPGAGYYVKLDRKKIQKEKKDIFQGITGEYVSKAMDLGYSFEEMVEEIAARLNRGVRKTKGNKDDKS